MLKSWNECQIDIWSQNWMSKVTSWPRTQDMWSPLKWSSLDLKNLMVKTCGVLRSRLSVWMKWVFCSFLWWGNLHEWESHHHLCCQVKCFNLRWIELRKSWVDGLQMWKKWWSLKMVVWSYSQNQWFECFNIWDLWSSIFIAQRSWWGLLQRLLLRTCSILYIKPLILKLWNICTTWYSSQTLIF